MTEPASTGYGAFISYSHADKTVATALYDGLTRLARPNFRRRAFRVFLDSESLSAGSLPESIRRAVLGSHYFILLASPSAARSEWVRREVNLWREHRSPENFLIAVVDGEVAWGDGDFDWSRTDALPPELSGWFDSEPLHVSLGNARTLSLRHTEFRSAVCKLAAPIRGVPADELDSEDIRLHRRRKVATRSGIALLCVLTLLSTLTSIFAVQQQSRAGEQAKVALSRALAAESRTHDDWRTAAQLAVTAYRSAPTAQAQGAMMAALERNRHVALFLRQPGNKVMNDRMRDSLQPTRSALSPDGSLLAYAPGSDPKVFLWDTRQRRMVGELVPPNPIASDLKFTPDGRILISQDGTGFQLWDVASRRLLRTIAYETSSEAIAVSPDSTLLAALTDAGDDQSTRPPRVWELATGVEKPLPNAPTGVYGPLLFTPDSQQLLVRQAPRRIGDGYMVPVGLIPVDIMIGTWRPEAVIPAGADQAAVAANAGTMVTASDSTLQLWDLASRTLIVQAERPDSTGAVGISADGQTVTASDLFGRVVVLDQNLRDPVQIFGETTPVIDLHVSDTGEFAATAGYDGSVTVLAPRGDARMLSQPQPGNYYYPQALAVRGQRAFLAEMRGGMLWDLGKGNMVRELPTAAHTRTLRAALNADSTRLATLEDERVAVWDPESGAELWSRVDEYSAQDDFFGSAGIGFLAGGNAILVDRNGGPELLDAHSGETIGKIEVPDPIGGFATDRDGTMAAVIEQSERGVIGVYRWDGRRLNRVDEVTGGVHIYDLAVSPDSTRIAYADKDNRIYLRDLAGGTLAEVQFRQYGDLGPLSFSDDGEILISTDYENIRFWEVRSGAMIGNWQVDGNSNVRSDLSDQGELVVGTTGTPQRWPVRPGQWRSALCAMGAGELAEPERSQYLGGIEVPPACGP